MHVTKLELKNFQSHTHSIIEFDKHFTCIVGGTNSGKTAIERALSFLFYNDWDSDFLTVGAKVCEVRIWLDSGISISRIKADKVNKYIIYNLDGSTKEYANFGMSVPEDISVLLGINELVLDEDNTVRFNVHSQDDSYFVLSKSDSFKNKLFSLLSGIGNINKIIRELNSDKRVSKIEVSTLTDLLREKVNQCSDISGKLQKYANFENVKNKITCIEDKYNLLIKLINYKDNLKFFKSEIDKCNLDYKEASIDTASNKLDFLNLLLHYKINLNDSINSSNDIQVKLRTIVKEKESILDGLKLLSGKCSKLDTEECPLLYD